MVTTLPPAWIVVGSAALAYLVWRSYRRISIADIRGPKPESFLLGNLMQFARGEVGQADFEWHEQFGNVIRFKGAWTEDRLMVTDPKALYYILHKAPHHFRWTPEMRGITRLLNGEGLLGAEGAVHARQRRVMSPGFGASEAKALFPVFRRWAFELSKAWSHELEVSLDDQIVIDVAPWITRATVDAVGEAAFAHPFGALDNAGDRIYRAYRNIMADSYRSKAVMFIFMVAPLIPEFLVNLLYNCLPSRGLQRYRDTRILFEAFAKSLVVSKMEELDQGRNGRDIMSLLVRANASTNVQTKLSGYELLSQMLTIMFAGHETVSNTLCFGLMELAKHPEVQRKLRNEIQETRAARGSVELTVEDFDRMPHLSAFVKEVLRYHPIGHHAVKQSIQDDVLPLQHPIRTFSGQQLNEVRIPKGLRITISISAYNRNKEIFGEDADIFNPNRWLSKTIENKNDVPLGVIGNLMTFGSGQRPCIGWRFAMVELQAFLVELIEKFSFAPTKDTARVRRASGFVMIPALEGEKQSGSRLPLLISSASA